MIKKAVLVTLTTTTLLQPAQTCEKDYLNFDKYINNPISAARLKMESMLPIRKKHHAAYGLGPYHPLKIKIDVSNLNNIKRSLPREFIWMETVLIPAVIQHMRDTFSVRERRSIRLGSSQCVDVEVPYHLRTTTQDADLILMFTATATRKDRFVAWAAACQIHPVTGRPIAGQVNINPYFVSMKKKKFFDQFANVLHEIYHVMGFANNMFKYFIEPNTLRRKRVSETFAENRSGRGFKYHIVSPRVVEFGRKHYGCRSLEGVPVEDNGSPGSAGSHWAKIALGNEMMVANTVASPVISLFTLKLLEDSGWYQINEDMAEEFFWAKGTGCKFIKSAKCSYSGHTCGKGTAGTGEGCFYDYTFQAICSSDAFQNQCNFFTGTDFNRMDCRVEENRDLNRGMLFDEKYGFSSRCFNGNLREYVDPYRYRPHGNFCYKARCEKDKISFMVNGQTYYCKKDGQEIKNPGGYHGFIKCPKIRDFCTQLDASCPFDCYMNGRCVRGGKCYCYSGYTGKYCKKLKDFGGGNTVENSFVDGNRGQGGGGNGGNGGNGGQNGSGNRGNNHPGDGGNGNDWYNNFGFDNDGWGYPPGNFFGGVGDDLESLVNWASGFLNNFF